jgi:hypothetical protein
VNLNRQLLSNMNISNWLEELDKRKQEKQLKTYNQIREWILSNKCNWATVSFRHGDSKFVNSIKDICKKATGNEIAPDDKNALQILIDVCTEPDLNIGLFYAFKKQLFVDWKDGDLSDEQVKEIFKLMANKLLQDSFNNDEINTKLNKTNFQNNDSYPKQVKLGTNWSHSSVSSLGRNSCRLCGKQAIPDTDVCKECNPE